MRFSGKTVVVTGAGRGIGAETARRFAAEGANAVIADINMPAAARVAASIEGSLAVEVDVTSRGAMRAMVKGSQPYGSLCWYLSAGTTTASSLVV